MRNCTYRLCLSFVLFLVGYGAPARAQNNRCGNAALVPQIFSVTVQSPDSLNLGIPQGYNPGRGRLTRSGIEYFSGNALRLEMVTDRCTSIREVRIGSFVLPNDQYAPVNFQASDISSESGNSQRSTYRIWLFLPPADSGANGTISLTVGRAQSSLTAVHVLRIARVLAVETNNTPGSMTISGDEIFNMFARGNHDYFGPTNSRIVRIGNSDHRIFAYEPSSLQVAVTGNGIAFAFRFKYDGVCNPTVRASGSFRLRAMARRIDVDWVNGPSVNLDWPGLCRAVRLTPLIGSIADYYVRYRLRGAPDSILNEIERTVRESIGGSSGGQAIFSGSSTHNGEVRIELVVPAPSVTLQIPYDPFTLPVNATAFGNGERLLLLAGRLGMNDAAASGQGTVSSGPNGLPLIDSTNWGTSHAVARAGGLVSPHPVGRLLARPVLPNIGVVGVTPLVPATYVYEPGCVLVASAPSGRSEARLRFGVNDSPDDSRRLRGIGASGYQLRVYFVSDVPALGQLRSCDRLRMNAVR